jgi:Family of unknown function (DUF5681)
MRKQPGADPGSDNPNSFEYEVGYARPPIDSRFKPGQSGNRKGRPKGRKNMLSILDAVLKEPVLIRKGNVVRKVSTAEAIMRALAVKAMKGDAKANARIMEWCAKSGEFDQPPVRIERIENVIVRPGDPLIYSHTRYVDKS